jgi:hypothetical protein
MTQVMTCRPFGQALRIRSIEAWPRWEEPLSVIQNTRFADT